VGEVNISVVFISIQSDTVNVRDILSHYVLTYLSWMVYNTLLLSTVLLLFVCLFDGV